ncbi:HAD family hydrolase [Synechococcus sp. CBW1002]|uniref:D-glycero-alpha-D-manno-heptose-1,7-bisphosphate 7-phosphatase n=1 Tax=Synechococcus sp. CBW1002 TaxID=1353134 RepID=UPI0018CEDB8A|nr:HAD family hydrolase [Synechococcus sp. CBW1002]QPN59144.1 HAD family hydrolase [Synechococcus sp. CBW1002]
MDPHLFLDRDGTLIREENYLRDPDLVVLENGAVDGLLRFAAIGYRLVVVSNQSGVGRGLITEEDVIAVNCRVRQLLAQQRVSISSWHHCSHRPDQGCNCRKPGRGLFEEAAKLHPVDWERSLMVGDKPSDVQAGLSLGMASALITTGYGGKHIEWAQQHGIPIVHSLDDMADQFI